MDLLETIGNCSLLWTLELFMRYGIFKGKWMLLEFAEVVCGVDMECSRDCGELNILNPPPPRSGEMGDICLPCRS